MIHAPILVSRAPTYEEETYEEQREVKTGRRKRKIVVVHTRRRRVSPGTRALWAVPGFRAAATRRAAIENARRGRKED